MALIYAGGKTDTSFADGFTGAAFQPHNFLYGGEITIPSSGTVTQLGVFGKSNDASTVNLKCALYTSGGNKVSGSDSTATFVSAVPAWRDSGAISASVSAGTYYVLMSADDGANAQYGYDTADAVGVYSTSLSPYASSMPSSIGIAADDPQEFGFRLDFTAGGGGGTTYTESVDETLAVSESLLRYVFGVRTPTESLLVSDAQSGRRTSYGWMSEALNTVDEMSRFVRFRRDLGDSISAIDSLVHAVIGQNLQVVVVSDQILLTDQVGVVLRRVRLTDDPISSTDEMINILRRVASLFDSVDIIDGTVRALISLKYLSDVLGLSDEVIATLVPFIEYQLSPRIALGVDDFIRLGSDDVIRLGSQDFIRLGVDLA